MKNANCYSLGFLTHPFALTVMLALAILFTVPTVSRADGILFTNFGAGNSYNTAVGNIVGNAFDGNSHAQGDSFTPSLSEFFTSLTIALSCFSVCPDNFDVSLTQSIGGAPGAVLKSFIVNAASLGVFGTNNPPLVLNAVQGPMLTAGSQYWITVDSDLNDSIAWNLNSTGDVSATAISLDGGLTWFSPSGQTPGAFEVDGVGVTVVPEPTSLLLVAPAMIALFGAGWGRRKATRIQVP
jgi:hypothetical protein